MPLSLGGKLFKSASVLFDMIKIYFDENLRPNIRVYCFKSSRSFWVLYQVFSPNFSSPIIGILENVASLRWLLRTYVLDTLKAALHLFQTITTIFLTLPLYGITTPLYRVSILPRTVF